MAVEIELPEDIEHHLAKQWGDLSRHALESLAIDGHRARVLSGSQVGVCSGSKRAPKSMPL